MKLLRHTLSALLLSLCMLSSCTTPTPTDVKVISYNIRLSKGGDGDNSWKYRKHASINMIRHEQPTLVGLQEMLPDQLAYLRDSLPEYEVIGVGRDNGSDKGEYMAIFYRTEEVELLKWGTFWLSESPEKPSLGWDASYKRTCTWATFRSRTTGTCFAHLNTHLDHEGVVAQREGLRLVVDKMKELLPRRMPVFVTGDFNIPTDNEAFKMLDGVLLDARKTAPQSDHRATYNGWGRREATIDHIFFRGAEPHAFAVLCDVDYGAPYISDHYPVSLTATIK